MVDWRWSQGGAQGGITLVPKRDALAVDLLQLGP